MMKKPYNHIIILILMANVFMGIVLFQQSAKLTEYEHIISALEVRMEDLDDAIEVDVVPRLKEIVNERNPYTTDSDTQTIAGKLVFTKAEEIYIFTKAVENARIEPGIVNMENPQYLFRIDGESYYLWITEDSGTIMHAEDTQTIYSLPSSSIKEIYEFVNKS